MEVWINWPTDLDTALTTQVAVPAGPAGIGHVERDGLLVLDCRAPYAMVLRGADAIAAHASVMRCGAVRGRGDGGNGKRIRGDDLETPAGGL